MPKSKQYVDQGMYTVQTAVSALREAANLAEKPENKAKIHRAISDLNCACNSLSGFQD